MLAQTKTTEYTPKWLLRVERGHPYGLLLTLSMVASFLLFAFLLWSWHGSIIRSGVYIKFPVLLFINSILLLPATILTYFLSDAFQKEKIKTLRLLVFSIAVLHTCFMALQISAWEVLTKEGNLFAGSAATGYLYVLSGLHLLHLLGALVMLLFLYQKLEWTKLNPVHPLLYTTDPFEKLRINLTKRYLRFVDIAWIAVLIFMWWHFQ
jgi:cytochrome c oxidase subunit 3